LSSQMDGRLELDSQEKNELHCWMRVAYWIKPTMWRLSWNHWSGRRRRRSWISDVDYKVGYSRVGRAYWYALRQTSQDGAREDFHRWYTGYSTHGFGAGSRRLESYAHHRCRHRHRHRHSPCWTRGRGFDGFRYISCGFTPDSRLHTCRRAPTKSYFCAVPFPALPCLALPFLIS